MLIKVCTTDAYALNFARNGLKAEVTEATDTVTTLKSDLGGPKLVGIYSLPPDKMFKGSGKGILNASLYQATPQLQQQPALAVTKASRKRRNRALRETLQPQELADCQAYLAFNQEPKEDFNFRLLLKDLARISQIEMPLVLRERGGAVVYSQLPYERIVTPQSLHSGAGKTTFVWYGTSGLYNTAELLLTMKAAALLGLPCRFDSYGSATPSATEEKVQDYRDRMREVAEIVMGAIDTQISINFRSTEEAVLGRFMPMQASSLARMVEQEVGHPVKFLHHANGATLTTDQVETSKTLKELHENGWWAAGALIYFSFYSQAEVEDFVAVVYNGAKGGIHRLARHYMRAYALRVCPAGSLNINASGEDAPINPTTLLRLFRAWGKQKSQETIRRIWDLAKVPLDINEIGIKHVVYAGLDGIEVKEERA